MLNGAQRMSDKPASNKTLLIVDDDPSVLQLIELLVGPLVAKLWTSLDPNEGMRLAIQHSPSLILLDNHMGYMLGVQVLEKLRKIPATAEIPIIMMTADNSVETVQRAAGQHLQGYLLKPCDPDVLLAKLAPWLDLPQDRPRFEMAAKLELSPEQAHQLEMRSLLQVLGLIAHELNLLSVGARSAERLSLSLQQLQSFRQNLSAPPPRLDLFAEFAPFENGLFGQLALFWQEYTDIAHKYRAASEKNLRALFRLLRERVQDFSARMGDPFGWKALPTEQVRPHLAYPAEAADVNALSNYETDYSQLEALLDRHTVALEIRGSEPGLIVIPMLLLDVLHDLSAYAYQHSPKHGELGLQLIEDGKLLKLMVSDTGPGMSVEQIKALTTSEPSDQALLKAYRATRQLGGKMWLSSQPGAGTDIMLELPVPEAIQN